MALPQLKLRRISEPPATPDERRQLISAMFDVEVSALQLGVHEDRFAAYYSSWYGDQCGDSIGAVSRMTMGDMVDIIKLIRSQSETRETVREKTLGKHQHQFKESEVDVAITLAARLWSISSIDSLSPPFSTGYSIEWKTGSLHSTLIRHFQPSSTEKGKLPSSFTAEKLDRIAGIKIRWTGNLLDHLKMTDDDSAVYIFHQVSFMALHTDTNGEGLPAELVQETIRTLSLLLPGSIKRPNKWYRGRRKGFDQELDPRAGSNGHLNASSRRLENFPYWGERLAILKQAFDDSEPKSVWHWWRDDRKRVQWYTFWIAVLVLLLTIVFGLLQSITAIIQTVATVKASNGH